MARHKGRFAAMQHKTCGRLPHLRERAGCWFVCHGALVVIDRQPIRGLQTMISSEPLDQ
jgi:hypothetical protein